MNIINDIKSAFLKANIVEKIIYLNVLLFLITALFTSFTVSWLALPANLNELIYKPWTIVTYAFVHERLFHLLSNLIILFYIGNLFLDFHSKKQFINFYFLGILVGAFTFLLYYYFKNENGLPLGGASAAISAIFVGLAAKIPRYALRLRFIGSVELWVLAAIWVAFSILQLGNPNQAPAVAHLGGAAFGYIYAKQLALGNDIGKWFEQLLNFLANQFSLKKRNSLKTVYKSTKKKKQNTTSNYNQQKIDEILDKIGKSGYESLSKEEKDFLFRSGKH
ncbi:MAG: rhomboid family intramembrane serine protease [Lutibacter sp.]